LKLLQDSGYTLDEIKAITNLGIHLEIFSIVPHIPIDTLRGFLQIGIDKYDFSHMCELFEAKISPSQFGELMIL
jgi:hypothetical protein